jgi:hypothetical protein
MGLLYVYNGLSVCDNIPLKFLSIKDTTFIETNKRFLRMLQSINTIPEWRIELMAKAVNLNASWLWVKHELDLTRLYEVDYGLLK